MKQSSNIGTVVITNLGIIPQTARAVMVIQTSFCYVLVAILWHTTIALNGCLDERWLLNRTKQQITCQQSYVALKQADCLDAIVLSGLSLKTTPDHLLTVSCRIGKTSLYHLYFSCCVCNDAQNGVQESNCDVCFGP